MTRLRQYDIIKNTLKLVNKGWSNMRNITIDQSYPMEIDNMKFAFQMKTGLKNRLLT